MPNLLNLFSLDSTEYSVTMVKPILNPEPKLAQTIERRKIC